MTKCEQIIYGYALVCMVVWVVAFILGLKGKKTLGNGMQLGCSNSLIIAALWPMSLICVVIGFVYNRIKFYSSL
jgi:hypothetical protein